MDHCIIMEKQNLLHESPTFKLANSSLCCKYIDDVIMLASKNEFKAIEWDLNYIPPMLSIPRQQSIKEKINKTAIEVRYHLPYSYIEIAHNNDDIRMMSICTLQQYINFIAELDGYYAILHIGYNEGSSFDIALNSLNSLSNYCKNLGIQLCIENLIHGLTTDACFLNELLSIPNIAFCLDTGHADVITRKNKKILNVINDNVNKICHAHFYKTEDSNYNHIPFLSIDEVGQSQIVSLLLSSKCTWLTMELEQHDYQERQMQILKKYLRF